MQNYKLIENPVPSEYNEIKTKVLRYFGRLNKFPITS